MAVFLSLSLLNGLLVAKICLNKSEERISSLEAQALKVSSRVNLLETWTLQMLKYYNQWGKGYSVIGGSSGGAGNTIQ